MAQGTLVDRASRLVEVDAGLKALLTPEKIREIVHLIPDEWLNWEDFGVLPSEVKDTYVRFLVERVANSEIFIKEAQHAREILV